MLTLAACGRGSKTAMDGRPGSGTTDTGTPDDPGTAQRGVLLERSDTLLFSSVVSRWSLAAEDETAEGTLVESMTCEGARCVRDGGTAVAISDLLEPADFDAPDAVLGARDGFEVSSRLGDVTVTAAPEVESYGFWGVHGYAVVLIADGGLKGLIGDVPFTGHFALASAYALGEVSGTNPADPGSATWTGIAEAVSRDTFKRHAGTATVTIADLSRPRVGVAIEVPGQSIGARWADMPLNDGSFASGTAGRDWLAGNFHGPGHEEAGDSSPAEGIGRNAQDANTRRKPNGCAGSILCVSVHQAFERLAPLGTTHLGGEHGRRRLGRRQAGNVGCDHGLGPRRIRIFEVGLSGIGKIGFHRGSQFTGILRIEETRDRRRTDVLEGLLSGHDPCPACGHRRPAGVSNVDGSRVTLMTTPQCAKYSPA